MNARTPVRVMLEIVVQRADGREERYEVARYMLGLDAETQQVLPGWPVTLDSPVFALAKHANTLLLGGSFTAFGTTPQSGFARFPAAP